MSIELEFLIDVVKQAGNMITDEFEVRAKDDHGDLITNFDTEIEQYIIKRINEEYPGFDIVSEEFNSKKELTDNCFTIDPIDGTINFAHHIPLWAIQVACVKEGKTCAAVIYIPKLNEMYYADENGAFLNGNPIHVNNLDVNKGLFTIEGPNSIQGELRMIKRARQYRALYCAAVNFAFVACGRLSATCLVWDTYWDYIPGIYICEKAGAVTYHAEKMHIAANNNEFLQELIINAGVNENEVLSISKKED